MILIIKVEQMNLFSIKNCPAVQHKQQVTNRSIATRKYYLLFTILSAALAAGQATNSGDMPTVRILESLNDLSLNQGITANSCLVIEPQGTFHMELRRQELPSPVASLKIYEGVLNTSQRDSLRSLLKDNNLASLASSDLPQIPATSNYIKMVKAEIQRGTGTQQLAYGDWSNQTQAREGANLREIEHQKQLESALLPLLNWFHQLQSEHLEEVTTGSTFCSH
jgi:hypothetical protein